MDSRFVNVTGDTMTGTLNITGAESVATGFTVTSSGASALANVARYDNGSAGAQFQLLKGRGTAAAPLPVLSGDIIGTLTYQTRNSGGTVASAGFQRVTATAAPLAANTPSKMDFGVSDGTTAPIALSVKPTGVDVTGIASINTATPATEAAAAKLVVLGSNKSAATLAETNTLAAVSIRPNTASGYTLAIGAAIAANNPYLQGVNFNGGAASAPLSIQPYGGNLGIGKSGTPTSTLDVVGTVAISGNITSTGTAHNFAANSITASAISGLPAASTVAGSAPSTVGSPGTSTAYARADHSHPTQILRADDLTDVSITGTPTAGQVLRFNGSGNFVNASLSYSDLTGTPPEGTAVAPSITAGLAATVGGTVGTSAAYARADHSHPAPVFPTLKADDLSDVTVATPAAGQVLRWNGTAFVNSQLAYTDLSGTPTGGATPGDTVTALTGTGTAGTATTYSRSDHAHPAVKLDDLTDVVVATPTFGQVIQYNGTSWVNQPLITNNPTILAPVLDRVWDSFGTASAIPLGQYRPLLVLDVPPVESTTLLGVHVRSRNTNNTLPDDEYDGTFAVTTLGKLNTVTGLFTGGVTLYSDWVSMALGANERHAVLGLSNGPFALVKDYYWSIRYYSATENGVWSDDKLGADFIATTPVPVNNSVNFYKASRTIDASDVGKDIANDSNNSAVVVFTLPADSVCPIGTQIKVFDCSPSSTTTIQCPAGQQMWWNSSITGGSNSTAGGVGPQTLVLPPTNFKLTLLKVAANKWFVFE
jgi:hypothetical protein